MKACFTGTKNERASFFLITLLMFSVHVKAAQNMRVLTARNGDRIAEATLYCDKEEKTIGFASDDLAKILKNMGTNVTIQPLSSLSDTPEGTYFVIGNNSTGLQARLTAAGGKPVGTLGGQAYAQDALNKIALISDSGNMELKETIGDIKAQAYLGLYYANKIRGAVDLSCYRKGKGSQYKTSAVSYLEESLNQWKNYANTLDAQYNKMVLAFNGLFDWDALEKEVENDIEIARNTN